MSGHNDINLLFFIPNGLKRLQIVSLLRQDSPKSDRFVSMIQIHFEVVHKHWPERMLQVHALILLGQFVDVTFDRVNKAAHSIGIDLGLRIIDLI